MGKFTEIVNLGKYGSEGIGVFAGEGRGEAVARAIRKEYGTNVEIKVPDYVYLIDRNFRRGFRKILPNVEVPHLANSDN